MDLTPSSARLNLRLQPAALTRLREAADLRQQDVTNFVLGAALERASDIIEREHRTRLHTLLVANGLGKVAHAMGLDADDEPAPTPDPGDPDIDLWADYRVVREPPALRMWVFNALKERRRVAVERGLDPEPADVRLA